MLLGTAARNPTIATSAFFGWNVLESLLIPAGIRPYLPFGLVTSLMGGAGDVSAPAAIAVLLAYLAAFALIVRRYALPRDLSDKPLKHPLGSSGPTTEGAPMPSPRKPQKLEPEDGSGAQLRHDQMPAGPSRATIQ